MLVLIILGSYAKTILNERPTPANAARLATRLVARSRRRNTDPLAPLAQKRRVVQPAAILLAAFAALAFLLAAAITVMDLRDYRTDFVALALARDILLLATAGGLLPVAAAYYVWAPRLLDRVREVVVEARATTKEPEPFSHAQNP